MRLTVLLVIGMFAAQQVHAQAKKFDGVYGNPAGTIGTGSACSTTRFGFSLVVRDGQASMRTVSVGPLEGAVHPDGAIEILQGRALLKGQIDGPKFTGTLSLGSNCQFALNYTRS